MGWLCKSTRVVVHEYARKRQRWDRRWEAFLSYPEKEWMQWSIHHTKKGYLFLVWCMDSSNEQVTLCKNTIQAFDVNLLSSTSLIISSEMARLNWDSSTQLARHTVVDIVLLLEILRFAVDVKNLPAFLVNISSLMHMIPDQIEPCWHTRCCLRWRI